MVKITLPDQTSLSLAEQIGQMLVVRASGYLFDHQIPYPAWEPPNRQLNQWLVELNLGGVILLGGSAAEIAQRTQQIQNWAKIPLLVAADIEEGVGQRFSGATWFPPPMALAKIAQQDLSQALAYATTMGSTTAREALSIGINWLLAPVVDVNNNAANPVINIRAFGETPELVTHLATAFLQGAQNFPVLTTAKHFPGHGDTNCDSHLELPQLPHQEQRLQSVELPSFQAAISQGVDAVMTAHLLISAWDAHHPATVSREILTGRLRRQLGFSGLIVTDSLVMKGITNYAPLEKIAVAAIQAGADILLMPADPRRVIDAILKAIARGELTEERIAQSWQRIRQAKAKVTTTVTSDFWQQLATPQAQTTVTHILRDSLAYGGNLPLQLPHSNNIVNLIVVDDLLSNTIINFHSPAVTIPAAQGYSTQLLDNQTLPLCVNQSQPLLLQVFVRGNPFRGSAGLSESSQWIYQQLLQKGLVKGLVIYGSPYVLDWFLPQLHPETPWVYSYGQMPAAQAIALEFI